jgi:hypothetical protein
MSGATLYLGRINAGIYLNGKMSDAKLWKNDSLYLDCPMIEGTGTAVYDYSGVAGNGTVDGTVPANIWANTDNSFVFGNGVSFWSADGSSWDEKTKAQMDTHYNNTNGSKTLWIRKVGDNIYEAVQYPLDRDFTPAEVLRNEAYFGGTSGALRDGGGDLITDVNGFVVFTA